MQDIDKPGYAKEVLTQRPDIDFRSLAKEAKDSPKIITEKDKLLQELITCRGLLGSWMGSNEVIADCEKHIASAYTKIAKYDKDNEGGKGNVDDLSAANDALLQIRQRLAQAWCSKHSKPLVSFLFVYHLVLLGVCAFLLVYYGLLPGQTSRLAVNISVVILFSSFLFGAIGGLFDGLSALKNNYGKRQFDESHVIWYLANAILGGILGTVVFVAILAGLLTTTGNGVAGTAANVTANMTTANTAALQSTSPVTATTMAAFILVVAFIGGLKQTTVITFLTRIATSVFGGDSKSTSSSTTS
jgi:hypothetical protein